MTAGILAAHDAGSLPAARPETFLTAFIDEQMIALPIAKVREVVDDAAPIPVPLASDLVAGLITLRGRIVATIDLRRRLGRCGDRGRGEPCVVVEVRGEWYSIMVDAVDEVVELSPATRESPSALLAPAWRDVAAGFRRWHNFVAIELDVDRLINLAASSAPPGT